MPHSAWPNNVDHNNIRTPPRRAKNMQLENKEEELWDEDTVGYPRSIGTKSRDNQWFKKMTQSPVNKGVSCRGCHKFCVSWKSWWNNWAHLCQNRQRVRGRCALAPRNSLEANTSKKLTSFSSIKWFAKDLTMARFEASSSTYRYTPKDEWFFSSNDH